MRRELSGHEQPFAALSGRVHPQEVVLALVLLVLPLHHAFAFTTNLLIPVAVGAEISFVENLRSRFGGVAGLRHYFFGTVGDTGFGLTVFESAEAAKAAAEIVRKDFEDAAAAGLLAAEPEREVVPLGFVYNRS